MKLILPTAGSWRRFFARMFDLYFEIMLIGFFAEMTLAKYSTWYTGLINNPHTDRILGIVFIPFALILDALICHFFGNSLGKYLLGIHIKKLGKISLKDWLKRAFGVWCSGFAFGLPLFSLWTFNKQQKLIDKGQRTTYDERYGFQVFSEKLSRFQLLRALIAVAGIVLVFYMGFIQQESNTKAQKIVGSPPYTWQNPVTKAEASIDAEWKNAPDSNEQGQKVYTFSEITDHAFVVLGLESGTVSLNTYVDLFGKANAKSMSFSDGGKYSEKDGIQSWECYGSITASDGSLLHIEIRKNNNDFWRVVTVQGKPYEYTSVKVEKLKNKLWSTIVISSSSQEIQTETK